MTAVPSSLLHYSGHQYLRHRLVLSILSGKALKLDKIRPDDKNPGLRGAHPLFRLHRDLGLKSRFQDYEVSLLRLIEKVTNGTVIEISLTGSSHSLIKLIQNLNFIQVLQFWSSLESSPVDPSHMIALCLALLATSLNLSLCLHHSLSSL